MSDVPLTTVPQPDDQTLLRYLVGRVPEEEAERLDELSVVDEEVAHRIRAVEHDLVDAYANGELTGDVLEGFRSQYLRSAAGFARVEFAEALRNYPRAAAADRPSIPSIRPTIWSMPKWQLAAAVLVLVASGYLLADNLRLRRRISTSIEAQAELEQRTRQLHDEAIRQQAATRAAEEALARAREARAAVPGLVNVDPRRGSPGVLALMLRPARRDAGEIPLLVIPNGADTVVLLLPLVAADFPQYEATLEDPASGRVLWRSGRLGMPSPGSAPLIPVIFPTSLLGPRAYTLELTGIPARGNAEPLDTYPFRVVP